MIIFCLVRFLPIKTTKLKFYKIQKKTRNRTETGSNQRFSYFILKTKTQPTGFSSIWFGFGVVRFSYFILKNKNYIVFRGFLDFFNGFGFGLVWFFYYFGSVISFFHGSVFSIIVFSI